MVPLIVSGLVAVLLWTVVARRMRGWHVTGAVGMVVGGLVAGAVLGEEIAEHLDTRLAERIVELILALLLFVDAIEVRGGFLAGERRVAARLLLIALPLTLAAAFALGLPLLGATSWGVVLALACVAMPVDFAPAAELLRDRRLPRRVRHVLAVESGYNDGVFSPVFAFALVAVGVQGQASGPGAALEHAVPAALYALGVGVGVGGGVGFALRRAMAAGWTSRDAVRIAVLVVPLVTYALAVAVGGNGFVAAFVAGIAYKLGRIGRGGADADIAHGELSAAEDVSVVASLMMWFVFGAASVLVLESGMRWEWLLYALLALTVARVVPVHLAMLGSGVSPRERTLLGLLGPRGTSSIVFGLLAYNEVTDAGDAAAVVSVMTALIIGSILVHGVVAPLAVRTVIGSYQSV